MDQTVVEAIHVIGQQIDDLTNRRLREGGARQSQRLGVDEMTASDAHLHPDA